MKLTKKFLRAVVWMSFVLIYGCRDSNSLSKDALVGDRIGVVASASMEPTLQGPRRAATCRGCQRQFQFSESGWVRKSTVLCPICGSIADVGHPLPASQEYLLKPISGWDDIDLDSLVAFERGGVLEVKRVAGLPHQHVSIRDGELWIDGVMHKKDWNAFQRQAIVVHAEPWESENRQDSRWKHDDGAWRVYHHLNLWPMRPDVFGLHPTSIHDDFLLNPTESKILMPVADVGFLIGLPQTSGHVHLRAALFRNHQVLAFEMFLSDSSAWLKWNGSPDPISLRFSGSSAKSFIAVAAFDDQLWVATDQQSTCLSSTLTQQILSPDGNVPASLSSEAPLAFQIIEGMATELIVFRDNYWRPADFHPQQEFPPEDGYILLGDHVSASQDSRHHSRIPRTSLRYRLVLPDQPLNNLHSQIQYLGE